MYVVNIVICRRYGRVASPSLACRLGLIVLYCRAWVGVIAVCLQRIRVKLIIFAVAIRLIFLDQNMNQVKGIT